MRCAVERFVQAVIVGVHGKQGRALGAKGPFVHGEVGVALGGDQLAVPHIGDDLTAHGTERTDADDFLGALDFELAGIGLGLAQVKAQLPQRETEDSGTDALEETPSGAFHYTSPWC